MAIQLGTRHGLEWATAPDRKLARAWGPLATTLEDWADRVVRMPAHCAAAQVDTKQLGDGSRMTHRDRLANAEVDELAKSIARAARLPEVQLTGVRALWDRVIAIAMWTGQATALAGDFLNPSPHPGGRRTHCRDSEGKRALSTRRANAIGGEPSAKPLLTHQCPQLAATSLRPTLLE